MATTTPNFGWPVPTSTDLVKDGATAIEALGDGIDTSLVDLKGGTTGQVLAKATNADMDFAWVAQDDSNAIQNAIVDAKGDLIAASAADTPARLAVGNNGETLVADSSTATGLKWTTQGQGATLISRVDFSNVASQAFNSVFSTTYQTYLISIEKIYAGTGNDDLLLQFTYSAGSVVTTTGYYGASFGYNFSGNLSVANQNNGSSAIIMQSTGSINGKGRAQLFVTGVGITAGDRPVISGTAFNTEDAVSLNVGYETNATANYDGFLIKSSSSNIYGTVAVYGLAK